MKIRELRNYKDWTQARLAEESGVSKNMIGLLERGSTTPTIFTLLEIAEALGEPLSVVLEGIEEKAPTQGLSEDVQDIAAFAFGNRMNPNRGEQVTGGASTGW